MADYKGKWKKSGNRYRTRRPNSPGRRPYTPRSGGGRNSQPRNYFRSHDFKYEREPTSRPPPKIETHYQIIERPSTESYRLATYRPEIDQATMDKIIEQTMERYGRTSSEQVGDRADQRVNERTEVSANLETQATRGEPVAENVKATIEETPDVHWNAQPESVQEQSTNELTEAENALELNPILQSEVVKDLEILFLELEGNPLEARPEADIEAEGGVEK